jgi:hypothetical protein
MIIDERVSRFIARLRDEHTKETDQDVINDVWHTLEYCTGCNDLGLEDIDWPCPIISFLDNLDSLLSVRNSVLDFSLEMEKKLALHDEDWGSEGWKKATHKAMLRALNAHVAKLWRLYPIDYDLIISAAADVANFAMMIADLAKVRKANKILQAEEEGKANQ